MVELEARISALELATLAHILQAGLDNAAFDPVAFASSRRDAWASLADALCETCTTQNDEQRFTRAYAASLERLGHLLVELASPVQEAIDEVNQQSGLRSASA